MIPEAAVEAAARAMHYERWPDAPWDALNEGSRSYARRHARAALEAAAPHIPARFSNSPDVIQNDVSHAMITVTQPTEISYETLERLTGQAPKG